MFQNSALKKESSSLPSIGQIDSAARESNLAFLKSLSTDVDVSVNSILDTAINLAKCTEGNTYFFKDYIFYFS